MGTARHAPNGNERAQGFTQARADLGDRGTTITGYAYAWDTRANVYNVVHVPSALDNRVTRYMLCENPDGPREREHVPWTDNVAQPARDVRIARIGAHVGTYATLARTDANARTHYPVNVRDVIGARG